MPKQSETPSGAYTPSRETGGRGKQGTAEPHGHRDGCHTTTVRIVSFLAGEGKIPGIEKGCRSREPPFHHGLRTAELKI
jgi:hypothetical protein